MIWLLATASRATLVPEPDPRSQDDWQACLVEHGLSESLAERLAPSLCRARGELGRGSGRTLLRGALLAHEAQAGEKADVERSLRDVREVERLLGAFTGELEKLDEVLEVLAAYAQKMRAKPAKGPRRTLH